MKPEYTPLRKLNEKSKNYTVKVKVIQKARPMQSPQKNRYQRVLLKDEEGTTMRGTLFNEAIDCFEQALQRNGEYELSGATVQPVPAQYQNFSGEYQLNLNERVKIKPLNTESCSSSPQYIKLATISQATIQENDLIDVLGIILDVNDVRTIIKGDSKNQVRDINVIDDSIQRPIKLSCWNTFATVESEVLSKWTQGFHIVGFAALKKTTFQGVSLTTTMSTSFIFDPDDDKADTLRVWAMKNQDFLAACREKATALKATTSELYITPIEQIEKKKANNVWQEEKFWISATLPSINPKDIYCYMGCHKCGRRIENEDNTSTKCNHCNIEQPTGLPKLTFTFYASDGSGAIRLTAFTKEAEEILGIDSQKVHELKKEENASELENTIHQVQQKQMTMQIGPTIALSTSFVLKWVVRSVTHTSE